MVKMAIFNVQRAITPKVCNPGLQFLCSARRLMVLNICVKFHENILNGFEVTEQTQVCGKNCHFFNIQRAITPEECNPELQFLHSAHCLILLNMFVKFHENISNGFELQSGQGFVTDRLQMSRKEQYVSPSGGDIITISRHGKPMTSKQRMAFYSLNGCQLFSAVSRKMCENV